MRGILLTFFALWALFPVTAQDIPRGVGTELPYTDNLQGDTVAVTANFNQKFKTDEERTDFKSLRNYLSEREGLLVALKSKAVSLHGNVSFMPSTIASTKAIYDKLRRLILNKKLDDSVRVNFANITNNFTLGWYPFEEFERLNNAPDAEKRTMWLSVQLIIDKCTRVDEYFSAAQAASQRMKVLDKSIEAVEQDINDCRRQIDVALAPEYKQQDFRSQITLYFSVLIALVLVCFFFIVYKNAGNSLAKDLLSGNGLQFITMFVLIIAVILFGILNILQSSELAAILAGISGYVLGRGTQKNDGTGGASG